MNDIDTLQIVMLLGWLLLAGSALASYRLSWKKSATLALAWAAIFTGVTLFINLLI